MTLRVRLLAGAAGVVLFSLLLSGGITWFLVQPLLGTTAADTLDQLANEDALRLRRSMCALEPTITPNCRPVSAAAYTDTLSAVLPPVGVERAFLVDQAGTVRWDSAGRVVGQRLVPLHAGFASRLPASTVDIDGTRYIAGRGPLPRRDPLGASQVVLVRSATSVYAHAAADYVRPLLVAGGVALAVALIVAYLMSRALSRPLAALAAAAEDVAGGNYARRVGGHTPDEVGMVAAAFDRMAAAVEASRQAQRDFLANVTHELKTPLTSLIGFSGAMLDGSVSGPAEFRRAAQIINAESERMLAMSQELLDLARAEGGHVQVTRSQTDVAALLADHLDVMRPRASQRGLHLQLLSNPGIPPISTDVELLHRIVDNLLENAVKYAPNGAEVIVAVASPPAGGVVVTVANPVGQHRPDPARMFDRFYRADPSRGGSPGVGLGLSISRELTIALGGGLSAEVDSELVTLRLLLP